MAKRDEPAARKPAVGATQRKRYKRAAERIEREEAARIRSAGREALARQQRVRAIIQQLHEERERQGLSLADVDERCGIGRSNLSRLENATDANPTLDTLMRYAEAMGCQFDMALKRAER